MRNFKIVDVFTSTPFRGNPVAVVLEADGLSDDEMQSIAAWTNLSETTFHLRPTTSEADYRLRIFSPRSELPFAGHPTLGSAHALLEAGLIAPKGGKVVQECGKGLIVLSIGSIGDDRILSFELPAAGIRVLTDRESGRLEAILGMPIATGTQPALVDLGARWIVAELVDAAAVLKVRADLAASTVFDTELQVTGTTIFGRYDTGPTNIEVRSFAPTCGVTEDPVCGSGNGAVAAYMLHRGTLKDGGAYVAAQGKCIGRSGIIRVSVTGSQVFVAGSAVTAVSGSISS